MDQVSGIKARVKTWIIKVIVLAKNIPKDEVGKVFINQPIRASTSVGANYEEASETQTTKDLIYKLAVVKKEAKESKYWLDLISTIFPNLKAQIDPLIQENSELIRIFSSIIYKKKLNN